MSHCSITEEAAASPSHPCAAELMGATLRAPIVGSSQMLGTIGAIANPDVHEDIEHDLALKAGTEVRPTQPPHPSLIVDVPSGYPEDLRTFGMPDTVNIEDILSVDVMPLSSIPISRMDVASCPDTSVAKSMSVDLATSMCVDFDDRAREIQDTAATPSLATDNPIGAHCNFRNSLTWGPPVLGDTASGGYPLTALGRYTDPDDSLAQAMIWTRTARQSRNVDSSSDFSFTKFDSRSALDRYFAEEGTRRGSVAAASADVQVGPSPWT